MDNLTKRSYVKKSFQDLLFAIYPLFFCRFFEILTFTVILNLTNPLNYPFHGTANNYRSNFP